LNNYDQKPTLASVEDAARQINGIAVKTPLLESPALNDKIGGRLLIKAECLQRTGSFKFRGAYNTISRLSDEEKKRGVFAYSSGNHAQGVAHAAQILGIKSTILMPIDTPQIKMENTRGYGAEVITYDRYSQSREELGAAYITKTNRILIKPYDNHYVISGQGTIGLEIAAQMAEIELIPDYCLAPCGGGGLISGLSIAIKDALADTEIYAVEPQGFDDTRRSLELKKRVANEPGPKSFCDAIVTPMPGEITFPILAENLQSGLTVSDTEVADAIRTAFNYLKIVIEPGGAVALAAILAGKLEMSGKTAVIVASGGNIDAKLYTAILSEEY
jgi:threonine dehydratase